MTHQPKTLALLISLIGAGVSIGAHARSDLRVLRMAPPALGSDLEVPAATALELTRWSSGLVWRAEEELTDLSRVLVVTREIADSVLPTPAAATSVPKDAAEQSGAEVPQEPGTAFVHPATDADLHALALAPKPRVDGPWQRIRTLATTYSLKHKPAPALVAAVARIDKPAPSNSTGSAQGPQSTVRVHFVDSATLARQGDLESAHTDRLMQGLATLLMEDVANLSRRHLLSQVAQRFPAAVDVALGLEPPHPAREAAPPVAPSLSIERRDVVVASPSDKVLRNLDAILTKGAGEPDEMIVATQAERVLATLLDVSTARSLRESRATREQRKSRTAATRTVAGLPTQAAVLPSLAPLKPLAATHDVVSVDIDLDSLLPLVVEPVATLASLAELSKIAVPARAAASRPVAPSATRKPGHNPFGSDQLAVAETSLDRVRGGFVTDSLNISFGIERAVYVNGALVTSTSLNVTDLGRITAGRGTAAFDSGTLALIQSGAGNLVATGSLSAASLGTVVQNTLDGQQIQNVTVINATVNSLGLLRSINLQSSLRGAVIDSLRR